MTRHPNSNNNSVLIPWKQLITRKTNKIIVTRVIIREESLCILKAKLTSLEIIIKPHSKMY